MAKKLKNCKIVCISLFSQDILMLDKLVTLHKIRGQKTTKSEIIRKALALYQEKIASNE